MKPPLLVGIGNPLAGDDGIGWHVAERLRTAGSNASGWDILQATDLLRLQDTLEGRSSLVLVDAILDDGPCGEVIRFTDLRDLEERGVSVHHLPPVQALRMLQCLYPAIQDVPVTFLGIAVENVQVHHALSPALADHLDTITARVLTVLETIDTTAPADGSRRSSPVQRPTV